jgi:prevent-host-death family protein
MADVTLSDLREHADAIVQRAAQGERVTVTVDGHPAATLGPLQTPARPAPASTRQLVDAIAGTLPADDDFGLATLRGDRSGPRDPFA